MGGYEGLVVFPRAAYEDSPLKMALEASAAMQTHKSAVAKGYHPTGIMSFSWHQITDEMSATDFSRAMQYHCEVGDWVCRCIAQVAEDHQISRTPLAYPDHPGLPYSAN